MSLTFSPNISASLHPANLDRFAKHANPVIARLGTHAQTEFEAIYKRLGGAHEAIAKVNKDRDLSLEGRANRVRAIRSEAHAEVRNKFAALTERLDGALKAHSEKVAGAFKVETPTLDPQEVRSFLRGLDDAQRRAWVLDATKRRDVEALSAVFGVPAPYLAGFKADALFEALRADAMKALAPGESAALEEVQALHGAVTRAATSFGKTAVSSPASWFSRGNVKEARTSA
jgi:hypothetical protein